MPSSLTQSTPTLSRSGFVFDACYSLNSAFCLSGMVFASRWWTDCWYSWPRWSMTISIGFPSQLSINFSIRLACLSRCLAKVNERSCSSRCRSRRSSSSCACLMLLAWTSSRWKSPLMLTCACSFWSRSCSCRFSASSWSMSSRMSFVGWPAFVVVNCLCTSTNWSRSEKSDAW